MYCCMYFAYLVSTCMKEKMLSKNWNQYWKLASRQIKNKTKQDDI